MFSKKCPIGHCIESTNILVQFFFRKPTPKTTNNIGNIVNTYCKCSSVGLITKNLTSLLDESSSSMWSEDMTASFLGRHFTLKPSMKLSPGHNGMLSFELDTSFDYRIWLHDETFYLPNRNPFGTPSKLWKIVTEKNEPNDTKPKPGLYHHITLTKQKKLNIDQSPCEEDPSYSFTTCTKEKLSQKIGCRLPWENPKMSLSNLSTSTESYTMLNLMEQKI